MPQRMIPDILKNSFSHNFFFQAKSNKKTRFDASMVFIMTNLTIFVRKVVSQYFQLVRILY
jgi:hypothetical protein